MLFRFLFVLVIVQWSSMDSSHHGPKVVIGCSEKTNFNLFDYYDIWNLV